MKSFLYSHSSISIVKAYVDYITEYTTKLLKEQYKDIEDIEAKIDKAEHDFRYYNKVLDETAEFSLCFQLQNLNIKNI